MAARAGLVQLGSHEYSMGKYRICRMGDDKWYVFDGQADTGVTFDLLRHARVWCGQLLKETT